MHALTTQVDAIRARTLGVEKVTGKRCKWIVTYRINGKLKFDGLYEAHGDTPAAVATTTIKLTPKATDITVWER